MRLIFLFCIALLSGCKTVELAVTHPTTGVHIVARMEGTHSDNAEKIPVMARLPPPEDTLASH